MRIPHGNGNGLVRIQLAPRGATFKELQEITELSAPTLSHHLKELRRDGLIKLEYDSEFDRVAYVIVDDKHNLMHVLTYFVERQKYVVANHKIELNRLERAAHELMEALKPFGKLPVEIQKLQKELEKELEETEVRKTRS